MTFAGADIQASKRIFAPAAFERAPLVRAIVNGLERAGDQTLRAGFFREVLRRSFSEPKSAAARLAIDWGRYAERYSYDADHDELVLDPTGSPCWVGSGVMSFAYRTARRRGPAACPPAAGAPRTPRLLGLATVGLRRHRHRCVVAAGVMVLLYVIVEVGRDATVSFTPTKVDTIDTSTGQLPYYAARSLLRMFIALGLSSRSPSSTATPPRAARRAEKVMMPALDILQSVPVLGFLSITVTGFIALFPGSYLGLECASIFAIFTSQAWNMTFSFYHSLDHRSPASSTRRPGCCG